MAYNGGRFNPAGSFFGGYAGGYSQTPGGIISPENILNVGYPPIPGANLPSVNPNYFPGIVHYGPSTMTVGPQPAEIPFSSEYVDPSLGIIGAPNFFA